MGFFGCTYRMSKVYPVIRLVSGLALMTLGASAMYASVIVLEPLAQEFETGRAVGSLPYVMFMLGFAIKIVLFDII